MRAASCQSTVPCQANIARAPAFVQQLTILAVAEAVTRSRWRTAVSARTRERARAGADQTVVEADAQAREAERPDNLAAGGRAGHGGRAEGGRRMTKAATATSTTMITGLRTSVLM